MLRHRGRREADVRHHLGQFGPSIVARSKESTVKNRTCDPETTLSIAIRAACGSTSKESPCMFDSEKKRSSRSFSDTCCRCSLAHFLPQNAVQPELPSEAIHPARKIEFEA